jgi:RNA polymerase sigma-70 factor (ECF subfamily)
MYSDDYLTVNAVLRGDKDGYRKLVDKYKKMVYGIAWSHLGDPDLSEDAAQETFLKAYTYLGTLREPDKFAGWLARIARNVCGSLGRGIKRENAFHNRWGVLESAETEPQEDDRESLSEQLWDSFAKLPVIHREALTLFYVEGKSIAEASAALGISEQNMRSRLHRARIALRAQLERVLEESLSDLQPSSGFTRSVLVLLPVAPKGMIGAGLLAVLGKLSASISFALYMAVSVLPVWAYFTLLGRLDESSLEDVPQNKAAKSLIRSAYRKAFLILFVTTIGFWAVGTRLMRLRLIGLTTIWQFNVAFCGSILLLVIIGSVPQLIGRLRTPGMVLNVLEYGIFFTAIAAIAFFKVPVITWLVAMLVISIIHYFLAPQMPPMPEKLGYNLFLRLAMRSPELPEADIPPSRELSKLEMRTFVKLLAELQLVRDYRFEGDTIRLWLFTMANNPLVLYGIIPGGSQITIRSDRECRAEISSADVRVIRQMADPSASANDLEEQTCSTMKCALGLFAEGRIQEVYDMLSFRPDRSSLQGAISARNDKIKWLVPIWIWTVMLVAGSARSHAMEGIMLFGGLGLGIIALAITLYINKRQNCLAQH